MLRKLRFQHGQALPMVLGCMLIFGISIGTVIIYSSSSQTATDAQKKSQYANGAAEAALATAISILGQATQATVTNPSLLPACPPPGTDPPGTAITPEPAKAKGYYCGDFLSPNWTIKATGVPKQTSAEVSQTKGKTITQIATIKPVEYGGLGELWNRLYQYDTSKCSEFKKILITVPVVTRGCLKIEGDDAHPTRLTGSYVTVGGNVTLKDQDSIGISGTPISRADIAGTCTIEHGSGAHSPCSSIDGVYATTITAAPVDFGRPTVDFVNAYATAKPGPMQTCTTGTNLPAVPDFDKNTNYNKDNPAQQLTPSGVSYDCQVWSTAPSSGTMLGQIKWDAVEQVFTVNGTVFFDGDVKVTAPGHSKACLKADHGPYCDKSFSYNGRGFIYTAKKFELEAGLCSGGDGGNDCETDPSNWDPTQNLLILMTGGLLNPGDEGFKVEKDEGVFQGAVYSNGRCKVNKKASISAPLICGQLGIKEDDTLDDPAINPWPASLIQPRSGQVWPQPLGEYTLMLQPQLGG